MDADAQKRRREIIARLAQKRRGLKVKPHPTREMTQKERDSEGRSLYEIEPNPQSLLTFLIK